MSDFVTTDPTKPPPPAAQLPTIWKGLGVESGFNPSPPDKLRLFIVSKPGVGKTTFVMGRPRNLVLSFEDSAKFVPNPVSQWVYPKSVAMYREIMAQLEKEAASPNRTFDCVTFDLVDQMVNMLDRELCDQYAKTDEMGRVVRTYRSMSDYGQGGKGISILRDRFQEELEKLGKWGYSWICTSHIVEKSITRLDGSEYTGYRTSVFPTISQCVLKLSDFMLGITCQEVTKEVRKKERKELPGGRVVEKDVIGQETIKVRFLSSDSNEVDNAKKRVFEEELNMQIDATSGYNDFTKAYVEACKKIKGISK